MDPSKSLPIPWGEVRIPQGDEYHSSSISFSSYSRRLRSLGLQECLQVEFRVLGIGDDCEGSVSVASNTCSASSDAEILIESCGVILSHTAASLCLGLLGHSALLPLRLGLLDQALLACVLMLDLCALRLRVEG